jgi:hypothetical protein
MYSGVIKEKINKLEIINALINTPIVILYDLILSIIHPISGPPTKAATNPAPPIIIAPKELAAFVTLLPI